ncbi:unnamed protein product [Prorocentrum cordatum]|uniref:Uncharacterized protein n=1 Tax=Prorocentrum cordatum TaxID=2364126 RepID=A0ABN9W9R8_9DINO|nr:unnamed protein product [Polarella glacialis]
MRRGLRGGAAPEPRAGAGHTQLLPRRSSGFCGRAVWAQPHALPHPSLDTQLDRGVRSFELDVFYDADADTLRVMHVPGSDEVSNCATLLDCLQLASGWSSENPAHFPLHFYIEVMGGVEMSDASECAYSDAEPAAPSSKSSALGPWHRSAQALCSRAACPSSSRSSQATRSASRSWPASWRR